MDREPEHIEKRSAVGAAKLADSGYTFSRLGLVPCAEDDVVDSPSKPEPFTPSVSPATPPTPHPQPAAPPQTPAWRPSHPESANTTTPAPAVAEDRKTTDDEYVRVTVKVPRALRDILRSCAKSTHQYQYVLVIEALAEFLVQLPEEMQRQLLRDVNGETIKKEVQADVPTSTWKRIWKRWLGR